VRSTARFFPLFAAALLAACSGSVGSTGPGRPDVPGAAADAAVSDASAVPDAAPEVAPAPDAAPDAAAVDVAPDVAVDPRVAISTARLRDKMAGGWVGQMVGVVHAGITEFAYKGRIIPRERVPWMPGLFQTAYMQDDLYVEVPFIEGLLDHGVTAGWEPLAAAFVDTEFPLWHGNRAGRDNLLAGIPAPESGHYSRNVHCDDIDWQIETDFIGLLSPGMPAVAADLAWRHGHILGFGDGVYGGVFTATMHAAAYTAADVSEVIAAGVGAIPPGSQFRAVLDDVITWHREHPDDWIATWQAVEDKWGQVDRCPTGDGDPYNIDAKLNAAYILIGLLYGEGDFEESVLTAICCGQDSDCNGSNVGGVLGTLYGLEAIPSKFLENLEWDRTFDWTDRTLRECVDATETLAREAVVLAGGAIRGTGAAEEWLLPPVPAVPLVLEQWPVGDDAPPVVAVEVSARDGRTVSFAATAADAVDGQDIRGWYWSFGDLGAAAGEPTATRTFAAAGTYEVVVWASDAGGNTGWAAVTVEID